MGGVGMIGSEHAPEHLSGERDGYTARVVRDLPSECTGRREQLRWGKHPGDEASGIPRRAKTKPIFALWLARRTSIGRVIVIPTPTAGPLIAAMTGFFDSKIRSVT